jgi:hypothetical protein
MTMLSVEKAEYLNIRRLDGSPWLAPITRGLRVQSSGGAVGRFVGVTAEGTVWIAWESFDFEAMCQAFDAQVAP